VPGVAAPPLVCLLHHLGVEPARKHEEKQSPIYFPGI
jgi:hypothetical protein